MTRQYSTSRWSFVTMAVLILLVATPASAGPVADCNQSAESDIRIDGCTVLIESGRLEGTNLATAHANRGNAYYTSGDTDRAVADYDKAIEIKPDYPAAYYNRGVAHSEVGDFDRAIADFDKAIEIAPDDPDAYDSRGFAYSDMRQFERAIVDFDKALELDSDFAAAYYHRGLAYGAMGELDLGLSDYEKAIELGCLRQGWCPPREP